MPPEPDAPASAERKVNAPMMMRAAETRPSSYQENDNSLEVVWSTGAAVTRFDWWNGEYYNEELSLDAGAVRLDRLNAGAAVLDTHDQWSLRSVLGSVVPGSAKIEGNLATARVSLADTADVADTVAKIIAGHIRNISVGYIVHQYTRIEKDGERPVMRADDWEPTEISFVPVPADGAAQVRSQDAKQGGFPCVIRGIPAASTKEKHMPPENNPQGAPAGDAGQRQNQPAPVVVEGQNTTPAVSARRISDVVSRSNLGADFALELIGRNEGTPMSEGDLTDAITERLAGQRQSAPINSGFSVGTSSVESDEFRSAMSNAILLRTNPSEQMSPQEREAAREFRGMTLLEMGRCYLDGIGVSTRGMDRMTLAGEALGMRGGMLTTSDFAFILQNAANKRVRRGFESAPQTFRPFISTGTLPDFKAAPIIGLGDAPALLLVLENGEFKRGSMADFGDSYKLATYGRIIAITRQTLVNDDMRMLDRVPAAFGRQAADLESDLVYAQLLANPTMYDGKVLFHADHGNLAGSGGAITETTLAAGKQAMRSQASAEGNVLNLAPRFLIVGPAKEVEAQKMLSAVQATAVGDVNVFQNSLELIVESRITGNQWFLGADPAAFDTIELASLEGQEGVFTESRVGFDVDGVETKARVDRVAKALDWRGLYKNSGN